MIHHTQSVVMHNSGYVIAALFIVSIFFNSGCSSRHEEQASRAIDTSDVYTLEVLKDRLEKDKYFLSHPDTPVKASDLTVFTGLDYYPPDKQYAFPVVLQRLSEVKEITMATSKDRPRVMLHIGSFSFSFDGTECTLQVFAPKDTSDGMYWFIPFTDMTNGESTYAAGRYVDIDDTSSDSTFLDFNYAYSPYCAYNDRYDCPIPPASNALPIAVHAGEKQYPLRHAP